MNKLRKTARFQELGNKLQSWRGEKFRSCLALFREVKLTFSYDSYVDFEKGKALPSPEQLMEIASCFEKDPRIVHLLWAKAQMPSRELDLFFDSELRRLDPQSPRVAESPPPSAAVTPAASFETTWVLGIPDRDLLIEHPWLWDVCIALSNAYPGTVNFSDLRLPSTLGADQAKQVKRLTEIIEPWLYSRNLFATEVGLQLRLPHLHLPKTEDWEAVRRNNFERAVQSVQEPFYRFVFHRPLTAEQSERWKGRLRQLEKEFSEEVFAMRPGDPEEGFSHVLAVLYGRRKPVQVPEEAVTLKR